MAVEHIKSHGTAARRSFVDPTSGKERELLVLTNCDGAFDALKVDHGCSELADVSADLDAWFCPACQRSGRISGAWAVDMWQQGHATDVADLEYEQVREHVTDILFDSQGSVDANCALCKKGVDLGIWAEFGYPDPFTEDDE